MGCKQCKLLSSKHRVNDYIEQNVYSITTQSTTSSSNRTNRYHQDKHQYDTSFTTIGFPNLLTLDNLPVELIYYIFDQLDTFTIVTSMLNVCRRLNSIINTYDHYHLDLQSISMKYLFRICSVIRPEQVTSLTLSDGNENVGLVAVFLKKFQWQSFKQLRSLKLVNIDQNEQIAQILLSMTNGLTRLSVENPNEYYSETVMDILMAILSKESLSKVSLDLARNRILNPSIVWPTECFLREIKLTGLCHISLFRNILCYSVNLKKFQAFDIDLDDEWIDQTDDDDDEDDEVAARQMLPLSNSSNLLSLSLVYARNEIEKLEWLLPQFSQLISFKYLNVYDLHIESIYESDYSLLNGARWEKMLVNCQDFQFISTVHFDHSAGNVHRYITTFQTQFWQDKNWNIAFEQYNKTLLVYSVPYPHSSYYYDRPVFVSIPHNPFLSSQSMRNVTKLQINLTAVNDLGKQIIGAARFPHVTQLVLDGQWRNASLSSSIRSLVDPSRIQKFIRFERVPTAIFQTFVFDLSSVQTLTLTASVLDSLNAAVFQYSQCLHSLYIVQLHEIYPHFVNVEPFCTMFPQVQHLDIPVDSFDSCQYIIDRLGRFLINVVFRFPHREREEADDIEDDDDDGDDEADDNNGDEDKNTELVEWAQNVRQNHQYRIRDRNMYLWLQ
ncbi:unnamed protein product [Adineta ricciae]|uniref:F-box domain-containing protein n=1 Tax=Adineta ricciae TaxID=249248 RepID=A0A815P0M9_ADIRI|nr:unnamed protein product [Adineta ricciae]CAF1439136.1 unnamed protein product [Adineta ricciae]